MFRTERTVSRMAPKPAPHFGEQMAAKISERGPLRSCSEATGIPLTTLHRRLKSRTVDFTLGELLALAEYLSTTASALVVGYEGAG